MAPGTWRATIPLFHKQWCIFKEFGYFSFEGAVHKSTHGERHVCVPVQEFVRDDRLLDVLARVVHVHYSDRRSVGSQANQYN